MRKYIAFCALMFGVAIVVFLTGFSVSTPFAIGILVLAMMCDTTTTYFCLRVNGREGNPVVAFFMKRVGIIGTFAIWWGIWGLIIYFRILPTEPNTQTAIAIAYWLVPLNNLWVLRRLTKRNAQAMSAG